MPRQLLLFCVAVAFVELAQAAETNGIGFDAIDDPLAEEQLFLPIDQAFAFTFRLHVGEGGAEEIVARWDMPEGYYLYRHGFAVEADHGLTLGELTIPPGEMRTDEYFGESVVYFGGVEVVAPVLNRIAESATVRAACRSISPRRSARTSVHTQPPSRTPCTWNCPAGCARRPSGPSGGGQPTPC